MPDVISEMFKKAGIDVIDVPLATPDPDDSRDVSYIKE